MIMYFYFYFSVYGVTFIGARQQIANALKDKGKIPEELIFRASKYLTNATFASIKEMFSGAREIMTWLGATVLAKKSDCCPCYELTLPVWELWMIYIYIYR